MERVTRTFDPTWSNATKVSQLADSHNFFIFL